MGVVREDMLTGDWSAYSWRRTTQDPPSFLSELSQVLQEALLNPEKPGATPPLK